jgi:hypothetical protein
VNVINRTYETGRKVADEFKKNMKITFDDLTLQRTLTRF